MTRKKPLSKETISKIREEVLSGKPKSQVAKDLNISYKRVWKHTRDIPSKRGIPQELRGKIRQEVLSGKSKRRVSIELGVSQNTVLYYTKDICLTPFRRIRTQDRRLELMKALLRDGYALASDKYGTQEYYKLKEHFPSISKVKMHGRVIFFLEGKEDIAIRALLENMQKKIISYHELKQVTKVFATNLSGKDKHMFLLKNRARKLFKNRGGQKQDFLREKGDSFSFFYIRRYFRKLECLISKLLSSRK